MSNHRKSNGMLALAQTRASLTTRIEHTQVLPGSGKAGVLKGLVAHGNNTLLFAVAGFGHKVHGLVVQAL